MCPYGPNVRRRSNELLLRNDLGRHVGRGTAKEAHRLSRSVASAKSEVNELDEGLILAHKNVLQLDVSVRDAPVVAIRNRRHDLPEVRACLLLLQPSLRSSLQVGVHGSSFELLHYEEHLRLRLYGLVHLDNARVVHVLEDAYFTLYAFSSLLV